MSIEKRIKQLEKNVRRQHKIVGDIIKLLESILNRLCGEEPPKPQSEHCKLHLARGAKSI
jgi:hypothetical protein